MSTTSGSGTFHLLHPTINSWTHPLSECQPIFWTPSTPPEQEGSSLPIMQEAMSFLSQIQQLGQAQRQAEQACMNAILSETEKAAEACGIDGRQEIENALLDKYQQDLLMGKDPKQAREELQTGIAPIKQSQGSDGICIFRRVNYNKKKISDPHLKKVAQRIANKLDGDVKITSGDRNHVPKGSSSGSLHNRGRAFDFHVDGYTDEEAFNAILEHRQEIFDEDQGYHLILHGPHTNTHGPHIHIDHSTSGSTLLISEEGVTPETKGEYPRNPLENLNDPLPE